MSEQWPQDPRWQQPQHGQRRDNATGGQGADGWSGGGWNEPIPHQAWSPHPSGYERIAIRQRIALTINRFEIRALDAEGNEGALLAMAEQKRLAMREQVTFWTDETRREAAFSMKARQVMDIAPTFDVWDGAGQPLGWFRKEFGKSFLRTTWTAEDVQGNQLTGTERSPVVAILRRLFGDSYFLNTWYHFDFTAADGQPALHHTRAQTFRDMYAVDLPVFAGSRRLDWRFAAALGVALDISQER